MKKIIYIVFAIFFMQAFYSCIELEREDFNQIYPENYFQNEADVKNAVTAMYSTFNNGPWGGIYGTGRQGITIFTEATTDVMDCQWGDGGTWAAFNEHSWTAENTKGVDGSYWRYNWLSRGEQVMKNINESPVTDDVKKRYNAQIKGIQGWMAFILYDLYGPVPVAPPEVLENIEEEVFIERPSDAEFMSYIETKLTEAATDLPYSYSSADWGRITKGAAKTILLKLYMMEKNWVKAEETAREIMKPEYGYKLEPNYNDIFEVDNEQNEEVILAIPCNVSNNENAWHAHTLPYNYPYPINVQKWSGYRMPWAFYNTYEPNDERLSGIIGEYEGTDGVIYNEQNPDAHLAKGALPVKFGVDPSHVGYASGHDIPAYRFADVLLCLAEAINNKNSGPNQEAYSLINQVRNRAGLDNLELGLNQEQFNEALLLERGHELYCEGHRRQDLIRFGKYIEYAKLIPNNQTAPHKVRFPIPNSAIVESKGAVIQNSGY
ncbi:MAG: RagB/SusD family nutrient uptake outer membrane protein [Bacteroidota bacterium]